MDGILKTFDLTLLDAQMVGVCIVLFVIFWKAMDAFVVRPFVALNERREAATAGARHDADSLRANAQTIEEQVEAALSDARVAAMRERLRAVAAAKKQAAEMVRDAEAAAQKSAKDARADIERRLDEIRARVMGDADAMARSITERLKSPRKELSGKAE